MSRPTTPTYCQHCWRAAVLFLSMWSHGLGPPSLSKIRGRLDFSRFWAQRTTLGLSTSLFAPPDAFYQNRLCFSRFCRNSWFYVNSRSKSQSGLWFCSQKAPKGPARLCPALPGPARLSPGSRPALARLSRLSPGSRPALARLSPGSRPALARLCTLLPLF
jgi:hypothetical protein